MRDLFIRDFERVVVDHERTYRRIVGYLRRTSKDLAERVELYEGREPLMEAGGVEAAVRSTLDKRVDLPSGGYLIFDYAEAFTVVDVNTGRFVGARGKQSGARLEDTITKNNLEAVSEVVRQLRLRDIGGIIVIDFIDMANPKNRQLVEDALKAELEKDRTKTYVVEISPLGLVEMTRQNVTDGPREIMTLPCPTCGGDGIVVSDETNAVNVERELRRLVLTSRHQAYLIELNSRVAGILIGPGASRLVELERETGGASSSRPRTTSTADHFAVLDRGPVSRLEAKSLPVAAGEELEVKLEAPHLHSEGDAVARLNGYVIAVAGAAGKVGKKVRVRIERPTRNVAYATLVGADQVEAPVEAGTELDREDTGEQPKRSRRGGSRSQRKPAAKPAETKQPRGSSSRPAEEAPPAEQQPVADGETPPEQPKRKKTRRGSRGGRGRKRKSAAAATAEAGGDAERRPGAAGRGGARAGSRAGGGERRSRRGGRGPAGAAEAQEDAPRLPRRAQPAQEARRRGRHGRPVRRVRHRCCRAGTASARLTRSGREPARLRRKT